MSCNGCRVLRKGCSDACVLRPSIEWIDGAQPQANATVFVAKFFGLYGNVGTNTGSSSSLHSSPENSTSAPARKRSKNSPGCGAVGGQQQVKLPGPGPVLQSCELDLCLTPLSSPLAGGRRGGASDEYSTTTCCEEASGDAAEAGAPPLLNLFN
ncbi:unnamed protein product [Triticum turgidum subsp. durum]|uniref:LOB domain-containing protein n=1 Tax=Triticum turgidum subsp. durum TaxID=4567 RepID=A0A9R0W1X0_TRITD|nr:unnamed protein product [Triticum turgidum subsp. durum]